MSDSSVNGLPTVLGSAKFLGVFENNSPEWSSARAGTNVGGSDVAAILGLSPWTSPMTLWAKKLGKVEEPVVKSEAMEWGTRLEPVVMQKFMEEHPELEVFAEAGTWCNMKHEWQIANPDGVYKNAVGDYGIVEIKTALYADDWANGVPEYYRTQVLWYLQTFGFKRAYVAVFFLSNRHYQEFVVDVDEFEQETNFKAVEHFRNRHLVNCIQPDFDGSSSTYETVRELHPDINPDESCELGDLGMHYANALAAFNEAESHFNEMKSRVLDAMGKAKTGLIFGEPYVTRQARGTGKPFLVNKKGK